MIVEIIATGSELLLGDTINTNSSWLGHALNEDGYTVAFQQTVGDNPARMAHAFTIAKNRADIIICTGGLGPTQGDITRQILADTLHLPMVENEKAKQLVEAFFAAHQRSVPTESNREWTLPEGSLALENNRGVAPGVALEAEGKTFILLPGPPAEMKAVFTDSVQPYLYKRFGSQGVVFSYRYALYQKRELELENNLRDLVDSQKNPTIAFLIKNGYIEVRITAKAQSKSEAKELLAPWDAIIRERLGAYIGRTLDIGMEELLRDSLKGTGKTVATAESCTSGLVGKRLGNLPGSSEYLMGGIISYSNDCKHRLLAVPQEMLATYGAVSEQVAAAMAEGTRKSVETTYGVSTTGLAGPGGATADKPIGLVYIGVAGPNGTKVYRNELIGNRESIRQGAAERALYFLYKMIEEDKKK